MMPSVSPFNLAPICSWGFFLPFLSEMDEERQIDSAQISVIGGVGIHQRMTLYMNSVQ